MAEQLRQEGREEGRKEALELVIRKMIADGVDLQAIARYSGFSIPELEQIARNAYC